MEFTELRAALPVVGVLMVLGWQPWRTGDGPETGPLLTALAVPAAFVAMWHGLYEAWPEVLPPEQSTAKGWVLPGLVVATVAGIWPKVLWLQVFLAWLAAELVVGAGHALLLSQVEGDLLPLELGMKAGLVIGAVSLGAAARRPGFEAGLLALVGLIAAAATVANGGWAQGALLLAGVGIVAGGAVLLGFWRPGWTPLAGSALGVALAQGGVLLVGYRQAEAPLEATLMAAAAPLMIWLPGSGWFGVALRLAAALGLAYGAYHESLPPPNPYY